MNPIIRQIVNRDCHVSLTDREVFRHVISRLRHGKATYKTMDRTNRRKFLKDCSRAHRANRNLYLSVMRGYSVKGGRS